MHCSRYYRRASIQGLGLVARLTREDVTGIGERLSRYDVELVRKTGYTLKEIAARTTGKAVDEVLDSMSSRRIAVVPITAGRGVIGGFIEAVAGIVGYMGGDVFFSGGSDISGIAEGVEKGADIIFMADDNQFIALEMKAKKVVYNVVATARGYVTALEAMSGGLDGREVLVIGGAGRVGWNAVLALEAKGARVSTYDVDLKRIRHLAEGHAEITVETDIVKAMDRHRLFFDASPWADNIRPWHIKPDTMIAAPATPLMLDTGAYDMVKERLIHDSLEIGVATMLAGAICVTWNS